MILLTFLMTPNLSALEFEKGIGVGVNSCSFNYDPNKAGWFDSYDSKTRIRGRFFAFIELQISQKLSVNFALRYTMLGQNDSTIGQYPVTTADGTFWVVNDSDSYTSQNYIGIPLKIKFFPESNRALYGYFGTEVAYLISAQFDSDTKIRFLEGSGAPTSESHSFDNKENLNAINLCGLVGFGYEQEYQSLKWFVELEYSHGYKNNLKDLDGDSSWLWNYKTRELSLSSGIKF